MMRWRILIFGCLLISANLHAQEECVVLLTSQMDLEIFQNSEVRNDFFSSLSKHQIPLKYIFVSKGARAHEKIVTNTANYTIPGRELDLLKGFIPKALSRSGSFQGSSISIVDVGPGIGLKARNIIHLLKSEYHHIQYTGIDFSESLLDMAKSTITAEFSDVKISTVRHDVEKRSFAERVPKNPNLFLLLGQTLGNPFDRIKFLSNIRQSMGSKDVIIVGVDLYRSDRVQQILANYDGPNYVNSVTAALALVGIKPEDGKLSTVFNSKTHDIETHFFPHKKTIVNFGHEQNVTLAKGEDILIQISHKFEENELSEVFGSAGMKIVDLSINLDKSYAVVAAVPKTSP